MVKPDLYDLSILIGFAALVAGIWWLAPPWALIISGVGLLAFGLWGSWLASKRPGKGGD